MYSPTENRPQMPLKELYHWHRCRGPSKSWCEVLHHWLQEVVLQSFVTICSASSHTARTVSVLRHAPFHHSVQGWSWCHV